MMSELAPTRWNQDALQHSFSSPEISSIIKDELSKINSSLERADKHSLSNLNISLVSGVSGIALCNLYAGRILDEREYTIFGQKLIEHVVEVINSRKFQLSNLFSFCNGLSGVGFTLNHLIKNHFINDDLLDGIEGIEEFLFDMGHKSITVEKSDFLHGGMGILYYFLNRPQTPLNRKRCESMIDAYLETARIDERGLRMRNTVLLEREKEEFDLGLAHGLAGHIIIFAEALKRGIRVEKTEFIIKEGLHYIQSLYRDTDVSGFYGSFPVSVIENLPESDSKNTEFYNSRLAWCYGDLNMALMYAKLGEIKRSSAFIDKANQIAAHAANRTTKGNSKVANVFFCHGSSGVSHIFHELYLRLNNPLYLQASNYWLDHVLEHKDYNFSLLDDSNRNCLLNGSGGVILTLLNRLQPELNDWNEFFLLK